MKIRISGMSGSKSEMGSVLPHSKLIMAAAREVLRPLGLVQRGRSRTWIDDHRWWIITVEFQPSSWGRGSYLNVAPMWLWYEKDYISFDYFMSSSRVEAFVEYRDNEQFRPEALRLATCAAAKVQEYRSHLASLDATARVLAAYAGDGFWTSYHAGVAHGLVGCRERAEAFFSRMLSKRSPNEPNWIHEGQARAREFQALLDDPEAFRRRIMQTVLNTRALLKLPALDEVSFT